MLVWPMQGCHGVVDLTLWLLLLFPLLLLLIVVQHPTLVARHQVVSPRPVHPLSPHSSTSYPWAQQDTRWVGLCEQICTQSMPAMVQVEQRK